MGSLKISVCVTIFNEKEATVKKLLDALNNQTLKPIEVIITDASNHKLQITNKQSMPLRGNKQSTNLKLQIINRRGVSRARGRNIAIGKARNEIIAITDAGCIPRKNWLARLTEPLDPSSHGYDEASVVAGGYVMVAKNNFEKAESIFLGTQQKDIDSNFMPSARSMAFTKSIWKKAGGFPENMGNTAEDTLFNIKLSILAIIAKSLVN